MKKMETAMNLFVHTDDKVMPLYDEMQLPSAIVDDANDQSTDARQPIVTVVHECSLRRNEKMNLYWRFVAGLHELEIGRAHV